MPDLSKSLANLVSKYISEDRDDRNEKRYKEAQDFLARMARQFDGYVIRNLGVNSPNFRLELAKCRNKELLSIMESSPTHRNYVVEPDEYGNNNRHFLKFNNRKDAVAFLEYIKDKPEYKYLTALREEYKARMMIFRDTFFVVEYKFTKHINDLYNEAFSCETHAYKEFNNNMLDIMFTKKMPTVDPSF
jgi:hypothetical protein